MPRPPSGASAPRVDKVRVFYNHPEFIAANAERVGAGTGGILRGLPSKCRHCLHGAQHPGRDGAELRL